MDAQFDEGWAPPGPAWRAAEEFGLDMSLVAAALRLSVWERMQQHRSALNLALKLRAAYEEQNGRSRAAT
jgi:hypothetical protein